MTIKGQLGIAPWDVLHVGLYGTLVCRSEHGELLLDSYYYFNCCCSKAMAEDRNVDEYDFHRSLYRFVQLDASGFHYAGINYHFFQLGVIVMGMESAFMCHRMLAQDLEIALCSFLLKKQVQHQKVRTTIEVIVAVLGWLLGGPLESGRSLSRFFLGQIVHYAMPQCRNSYENYR